MYRYRHKIWIANEDIASSTDLVEYQDAIYKAVKHYNDVSARARNPKKILEFKVDKRYIALISESIEPLARPNLALQVFSSFLANGELAHCVKNKALFRGEAEEVVMADEKEKMSEDQLLLAIIKIFRGSSSENRKKIEAFRKIIGE